MPLQRTPPSHLRPPAAELASSSSLASISSDSSLINTPTRGGTVSVVPPSPFGTRKSALPRTPPDGKRASGPDEEEQRSVKRPRLSPPRVLDEGSSTTPTGPAPAQLQGARRRSSRQQEATKAVEVEKSRSEEEQEERENPAPQTIQQPESRTSREPSSRSTSVTPASLTTTEDYGQHYSKLLKVLEIAVLKGANKWTAEDFCSFFPIHSAGSNRKAFEDVWSASAQTMRDTILSHAHALLGDYKAGSLLKLFNEVLEDAKAAREAGEVDRLGAWRPEVSPAALTAASNLPGYDEIYARLHAEHTELFDASDALYTSMQKKRAELAALEEEIKEAASELDGTLQALEGFPDDDMQQWTWNVVRGLENKRAPDRVEA